MWRASLGISSRNHESVPPGMDVSRTKSKMTSHWFIWGKKLVKKWRDLIKIMKVTSEATFFHYRKLKNDPSLRSTWKGSTFWLFAVPLAILQIYPKNRARPISSIYTTAFHLTLHKKFKKKWTVFLH